MNPLFDRADIVPNPVSLANACSVVEVFAPETAFRPGARCGCGCKIAWEPYGRDDHGVQWWIIAGARIDTVWLCARCWRVAAGAAA